MIAEYASINDAQVLPAVAVHIPAMQNRRMRSVEVMYVLALQPGNHSSATVEDRFHDSPKADMVGMALAPASKSLPSSRSNPSNAQNEPRAAAATIARTVRRVGSILGLCRPSFGFGVQGLDDRLRIPGRHSE